MDSCTAWKTPTALGRQVPSQQGSEEMPVTSTGQYDLHSSRTDLFLSFKNEHKGGCIM